MGTYSTIPIILTTLLAIFISCTPAPEPSSDLQILSSWLTGSFSSQQQATADISYYDIRLEMVPIWTDLPPVPAPPRGSGQSAVPAASPWFFVHDNCQLPLSFPPSSAVPRGRDA